MAIPPLSVAELKVVPPSIKVTLPVASAGDTVAVKVTLCGGIEGLGALLRVAVAARPGTKI
jgi:hypothetical protein